MYITYARHSNELHQVININGGLKYNNYTNVFATRVT